MWSNLPFDVLANIFSFLPPDSLARARSACQHWNTCAGTYTACAATWQRRRHPAWFVGFPTRCHRPVCFAYSPAMDEWHAVSLDFIPGRVRPTASAGGIVLVRPTAAAALQLAICNPFTRQFKALPMPKITRTNPVVGVIELGPTQRVPFPSFRVYVAGGSSEAPSGGASYEPTLEVYDSHCNTWQIMGSMPVEFAVRLTVWTPKEGVYSNGFLYWITSARAYSVMGLEIGTNMWREVAVPLAAQLQFASLVPRNGKLTLVGGTFGTDTSIWELGDGDAWELIDRVPGELGTRLVKEVGSWSSVRCVGIDGAMWLYRDLEAGMVVWRAVDDGKWEWFWVKGLCHSMRSRPVQSFPVKGVLLHPILDPLYIQNT